MKPIQVIQYSNNTDQGISRENSCPDNGILAIEDMQDPTIYYFFIWVIICISLEQAIHVCTLLWKNYNSLKVTLNLRPYQFQTGLALLWTLFTASSHILVCLTWRSNAAVFTKGLHVLTEAIFLIQIALSLGFRLFASVCSFLIFVILIFVTTLPCKATVTAASYSGIILDSVNFVAHLMYGLSNSRDPILWRAISAFGFHLLYLSLFVLVENENFKLSQDNVAILRIVGAYCNYIAGEIFINICYKLLYNKKSLWVRSNDWIEENTIVNVWKNDELIIFGASKKNDFAIDIFEPYTTAFDGFNFAILNMYFPIFGRIWVTDRGTSYHVEYSILCTIGKKMNIPRINTFSDKVFVLNWYVFRLPFIILSVIISVIMTLL